MNKIFLVAITAGVLLIAGIVTYSFIQQQLREQKEQRIKTDLANYSLQLEYNQKFDAYFNHTQAHCGLDKACYDASFRKHGLADPKFDVIRGEIK